MKKFVFIFLLISFISAPFINGAVLACADDHRSRFCEMQADHEDISHHCVGCGHAIDTFQEIVYDISYAKAQSFELVLADSLRLPDNIINLYHPPIA